MSENRLVAGEDRSGGQSAKTVYILYLGSVVLGITGIIGVVMAYIYKDDAPDWLKSHYRFQVRTFWIGMLYLFVGCLLSSVLIGYLILLLWLIWLIARCIKGIKSLDQHQPHSNPTTWMF